MGMGQTAAVVASSSSPSISSTTSSSSSSSSSTSSSTSTQAVATHSEVKGPWTDEEDKKLMEVVGQHGAKNWSTVIAITIPGRNRNQCRERWIRHLNPDINKGPWSEEEDRIILTVLANVGNKWTKMATQLPGRPDNDTKNHWHSSMKKEVDKYLQNTYGNVRVVPDGIVIHCKFGLDDISGILECIHGKREKVAFSTSNSDNQSSSLSGNEVLLQEPSSRSSGSPVTPPSPISGHSQATPFHPFS